MNILLTIYLITVGISALTWVKILKDMKADAEYNNIKEEDLDKEKVKREIGFLFPYIKALFLIFCPILNIIAAFIIVNNQAELRERAQEEINQYINKEENK